MRIKNDRIRMAKNIGRFSYVEKNKVIVLGLIFTAFLILSVIYGRDKVYFYEDEVLSYTLANRQGGGVFCDIE